MDSIKKSTTKNLEHKYDVIVIGGIKVLLVEQHSKVGGYCSSFTRKGFTFDTGIHALGSCRDDGYVGRILNDLDLKRKISVTRVEPSDTIFISNGPHSKDLYNFWSNLDRTIEEFQAKFPRESKNIKGFFNFLDSASPLELYIKLRGKTFKDFLDENFTDQKLKSILGTFLGCLQLPSDKACAVSTAILYKEFILDGGYYPEGGMQNFSNIFAENFIKMGGTLLLQSHVTKITVNSGKIEGAIIENNIFVKSKYVVSCCDVKETFFEMLDQDSNAKKIQDTLSKLNPSTSAFAVYLGLKNRLDEAVPRCCSLWYASSYNIDSVYSDLYRNILNLEEKYVLFSFVSAHDSKLAPKNKESLCLIIGAPYLNENFWQTNKKAVTENLIKRASAVVPNINDMIEVKESASPLTFRRYTHNYQGAFRGWASTPSQTRRDILPPEITSIQNLFLAGHWITQPAQGGIPMVAYSGRNIARTIYKKEKGKLANLFKIRGA